MKAKDIADLLYHYFIQNSSLSLPGIGTFDMYRISAQADFANKKMLPPTFTISYNYIHDSPKKELFDFISRKKNSPKIFNTILKKLVGVTVIGLILIFCCKQVYWY